MNKETYEALKRIIVYLNSANRLINEKNEEIEKELWQVKGWIDEVAKEYKED